MAKDGGGGSETIIPGSAMSGEIHPKGLFEAISAIETQFANELRGCVIAEERLTTQQRIEFFEVGFRSSLVSGLLMACMTPIAIGVVERYIPVFGSAQPTAFDMVFAFLLAIGFSLGYSIFLSTICARYLGNFTRAMIKNLIGGMMTGSMIKMVVVFLLFHFIYLVVLSEKHLLWAAEKLYSLHVSQDTVVKIYDWTLGFRGVFLISAWFVVATTVIFMSLPAIAMFLAARRNKKLIEAGIIHVE